MATAICKNCNKEFTHTYSTTGKYCSNKCSSSHRQQLQKQQWLVGDIDVSNRRTLKSYLSEMLGWRCVCCKNTEWQGQLIPLELDHIDGNAGNNRPENLRLLCPNCHSQTPTHKAKNKGNGRGSRGLPFN